MKQELQYSIKLQLVDDWIIFNFNYNVAVAALL